MPARQDAYSVSIPHTKRQMEAANRSSSRRSGGRTSYPHTGHHSSSSPDYSS
ncbi:hypothetical protein CSHISOI_02422 [Colletotrichum shisoi]|uniref:Uncharacterized protein n=1 Tax=Colletotrichum shisoi TaxID=2078593 RepID=A0A5Q4C131_9PEZI|nr:hypothetical protein CSHISOI_02422 [Colletotrichum shisoi]